MPVTFQDIQKAKHRLQSQAHVTPVMTSRSLNQLTGASLFFKCENFQRVGAFKFRGAYNAIASMSEADRKKGVIAYSSGNHAQAVALAASLFEIPATIVMPDNAPKVKLVATRNYGAEVITFDPQQTTREAVAQSLQKDAAKILIKPFDYEPVIAGQGTATLELFEQVGPLDNLLVPCGGGGLLSGSAIAAKHLNPDCRVIGVEPAQADDATRSFYSGKLHRNPNPDTIADGTRTTSLGDLTFPLICRYVDEMVTVSEHAIMQAVSLLFSRMKIVVEPSGALPLAAILSNKIELSGRTGLILSGGNIDASTMAMILSRPDPTFGTN